MSDYCCYPSVASETYNPAEIRLYGRVRPQSSTSPEVLETVLKISQASTELSSDQKTQMESGIKQQVADTASRALAINMGAYRVSLDVGEKTMQNMKSVGVIYGYAFEGHCYQLPKPMVMLLPVSPMAAGTQVNHDCGYTKELGYSVWVIDKLERVVILDVRTDDLKTLVLDANTPGSRSPLAYSQAQALAPQRNRDYPG